MQKYKKMIKSSQTFSTTVLIPEWKTAAQYKKRWEFGLTRDRLQCPFGTVHHPLQWNRYRQPVKWSTKGGSWKMQILHLRWQTKGKKVKSPCVYLGEELEQVFVVGHLQMFGVKTVKASDVRLGPLSFLVIFILQVWHAERDTSGLWFYCASFSF